MDMLSCVVNHMIGMHRMGYELKYIVLYESISLLAEKVPLVPDDCADLMVGIPIVGQARGDTGHKALCPVSAHRGGCQTRRDRNGWEESE